MMKKLSILLMLLLLPEATIVFGKSSIQSTIEDNYLVTTLTNTLVLAETKLPENLPVSIDKALKLWNGENIAPEMVCVSYFTSFTNYLNAEKSCVKKNFTWQPTLEEPLNIVVEEIPQLATKNYHLHIWPIIGVLSFFFIWVFALNFRSCRESIIFLLQYSALLLVGTILMFFLCLLFPVQNVRLFFALIIFLTSLYVFNYLISMGTPTSQTESSSPSFLGMLITISLTMSFAVLPNVLVWGRSTIIMIDYMFWLATWETTIIILFFAVTNLVPAEKIDSMLSFLKLKVQ
jgi:hypothetical protein